MNNKEGLYLLFRYLLILLLAISNLYLFYKIFTPITLFSVAFILKLFYNAQLLSGTSTIFLKGFYIELIPACIAGSAYYLLLILNFTTPMHIRKRIKSLSFILLVFLILNISRIIFFAVFLAGGYKYFDLAHELTWYFGSTILVIFIWFLNVWIFKINTIPIYTDTHLLFNEITKPKEEFKHKYPLKRTRRTKRQLK